MINIGNRLQRKAGVIAIATALSLTTASAALAQQHVIIKGGQIGGGFNRWTSAWSVFLSKAVPGVNFSSESSTGSAENMRAVGSGQVNFGLVFASDLYDGYRGNAPFKKVFKDVRALTYVYATVDHFVVPASSSIKTIADVKGKRVSFGGPGSGSAAMIGQLMEQVGVRKSVTAVYLGSKAPQALANGKIDAYNWAPGLGNATIRNTAAMLKIRFLNLDEPARKSGFYDKYPYYGKIIIPGGLYSGVDQDTPTFGTGSILVANKNAPDDLVYKVLKAIYSDAVRKEMAGAVGAASIKAMNKDAAFNYITVPLHPGAEKYWKEQGKAIPAKLKSQ
jgi:uncharacterized protein